MRKDSGHGVGIRWPGEKRCMMQIRIGGNAWLDSSRDDESISSHEGDTSCKKRSVFQSGSARLVCSRSLGEEYRCSILLVSVFPDASMPSPACLRSLST